VCSRQTSSTLSSKGRVLALPALQGATVGPLPSPCSGSLLRSVAEPVLETSFTGAADNFAETSRRVHQLNCRELFEEELIILSEQSKLGLRLLEGRKARTGDATRACRSLWKGPRSGLLESRTSASVAVTMALTCSRLTTTARSRTRMVEGEARSGSSTRRSRVGTPVISMIRCFPSSASRGSPAAGTTSHFRLGAAPFRRVAGGGAGGGCLRSMAPAGCLARAWPRALRDRVCTPPATWRSRRQSRWRAGGSGSWDRGTRRIWFGTRRVPAGQDS
jgi:hypothetical protein